MSEPAALDLAAIRKRISLRPASGSLNAEILRALDELERCRAERDALRADNDALRHIIENAKAWNDELGRSNAALGEVTP